MARVYFTRELTGFPDGFVPQNREELLANPPQPRQMKLYVDPETPYGKACLMVKSIEDHAKHSYYKGLRITSGSGEGRRTGGRWYHEFTLFFSEDGFEEVGKVDFKPVRTGYTKRIMCSPDTRVLGIINDYVAELESAANAEEALEALKRILPSVP